MLCCGYIERFDTERTISARVADARRDCKLQTQNDQRRTKADLACYCLAKSVHEYLLSKQKPAKTFETDRKFENVNKSK